MAGSRPFRFGWRLPPAQTLMLGVMAAMAPVSTDMYVPAFTAIAADLATDLATLQLSLVIFLLGMAVGQLLLGPISDVVGRRPPLLGGTFVFALASLLCAFAPDGDTLLAGRFLQGLGSAAGLTMARAIVRDRSTGAEAARMLASVIMVISVAPLVAPFIGSLLVRVGHWSLIFVFCALLGLAGLAVTQFGVGETNPREKRAGNRLGEIFARYITLLRDPVFVGYASLRGLTQALFFAYLSGGPVIYMVHFGLDPTLFSLLFSANAITTTIAIQFVAPLMRRMAGPAIIRLAGLGLIAAVGCAIALHLAFPDSVAALALPLYAGFAASGLVGTTAMVMALETHGEIAGTASAMVGTFQLVGGALVVTGMTRLPEAVLSPLGVMLGCAVAILIVGLLLGRR